MTTVSKNKTAKEKQTHRYSAHFDGCQIGVGGEGLGDG